MKLMPGRRGLGRLCVASKPRHVVFQKTRPRLVISVFHFFFSPSSPSTRCFFPFDDDVSRLAFFGLKSSFSRAEPLSRTDNMKKRPREEEAEEQKEEDKKQAADGSDVSKNNGAGARPPPPPPPPPPVLAPPPPPPQLSIPGLELPTGWLSCPRMGRNLKNLGTSGFNVAPAKAPLGRRFVAGGAVPPSLSFTPADAVDDFASKGMRLGLVLDLTNTGRYYDPAEWGSRGVAHQKIFCPPRGRVPHPESVSHFCFEMLRFTTKFPGDFVLVHCTHGFNRTGFMLCSWMVRYGGVSVAEALSRFAQARPPGIYKDDYIEELFRYNHERRPATLKCPPVPDFKAGEPDSPRRDGDEGAEGGGEGGGGAEKEAAEASLTPVGAGVPEGIDHDSPFGEAIHPEEEDDLRRAVFELVSGRQLREHELPHFPGSQPVSLARENLPELSRSEYRVTWKADGTRYLLAIMPWGAYFIDRALGVQRVQARFPCRCTSKHAAAAAAAAANAAALAAGLQLDPSKPPPPPPKDFRPPLIGPPHFQTLLDGEMVVDEDLATGMRTRRFLVYDAVVLNGKSLVEVPFKQRYEAIEAEVVAPRSKERDAIDALRAAERAAAAERVKAAAAAAASGRAAPPPPPLSLPSHLRGGALKGVRLAYDYSGELFRLRRKEFWPLQASRNILDKFIPRLSHESDGLILQPASARYVTGTFHQLLKWKFAHMNSVDFKLKIDLSGDKTLYLLETRRDRPRRGEVPLVVGGGGGGGQRASAVSACDRVDLSAFVTAAADGTVADERALSGKIIECAWDPGRQSWVFMRVRTDKDTPNAVSTYEKVVQSIEDDITEGVLLREVDAAVAALEHKKSGGDAAAGAGGGPSTAAAATAAAAAPPPAAAAPDASPPSSTAPADAAAK